jgi:hypothetical protein
MLRTPMVLPRRFRPSMSPPDIKRDHTVTYRDKITLTIRCASSAECRCRSRSTLRTPGETQDCRDLVVGESLTPQPVS